MEAKEQLVVDSQDQVSLMQAKESVEEQKRTLLTPESEVMSRSQLLVENNQS